MPSGPAERDDDDRVVAAVVDAVGPVGRLLALLDGRRHDWHGATMQDWTDPDMARRRNRPGSTSTSPARVRSSSRTSAAWATALRVPTGDGTLWFKANVPALAHELPVVEVLASPLPGRGARRSSRSTNRATGC